MEAIWVAAEMRVGAAYAHSTLAIDTMLHVHGTLFSLESSFLFGIMFLRYTTGSNIKVV